MTLRLRIVSDHRRLLGDRSSIEFGADGGTIGRSADNDWVLPDPLRYVSAHHARIHFREGSFYLEDLSTNGIFLNDDERALGKVAPDGHRLRSGDLFKMGEYQIVAALAEAPEQAFDPEATATAVDTGQVPTSIHGLRSLPRAPGQTDLGAMLNLDDLLVSQTPATPAFHPVNAYGQAIAHMPAPAPIPAPVPGPAAHALASAAALAHAPAHEVAPPIPVSTPLPVPLPVPTSTTDTGPQVMPATSLEEDVALERKLARAARVSHEARNGVSAPALYDAHSGLQAFCRGAGVEVERLPADAQTRLLHLAGQLFREALVGLKDLERSRHETRNRFRVEIAPDPEDTRPSLERSSVDDLVIELMAQHEARRLDAVGWLRAAVTEGKQHEMAAGKAMRAAFVEFLDRLDPAELEARFERAARRGKARASDKAQYWELYTTFYRNLIEMPADHLPHTFVEAFAAAYRESLKKNSDSK